MPGLKVSPSKVPSSSPQRTKSPGSKKGKERASAPSPSSSAPARSPRAGHSRSSSPSAAQNDVEEEEDRGHELLALANEIARNAHLLVRGRGDVALESRARDVVKHSFDRALESESTSFPHLQALLASLTPSTGPTTRSASSRAAAARGGFEDDSDPEPPFVLEPTPIPELTIDEGMDAEMIWEQMELRSKTVDRMMDEMFGQEEDEDGEGDDEDAMFDDGDEDDEDDDEEAFGMNGEGDDDEDESSEEGEYEDVEGAAAVDDEYVRRLGDGKEEGLDSEDTLLGLDDEAEEEDEEDEDEEEQSGPKRKKGVEAEDADDQQGLTLDNFDGDSKGKRARPSKRAAGPPSAVDDDFFSLHDFHVDADEGEFEMAKMMKGEADDDDDDDDDGENGDGGIDLFAPIGGMGNDDDDDEDEDEEEGDLDAGGVMYKDFFDPPSRPVKRSKPTATSSKPKSKATSAPGASTSAASTSDQPAKRSVRFSESVKVKTIPSRHDLKAALRKGKGKAMTEEELDEEVERELVAASSDEEEDVGEERMDFDEEGDDFEELRGLEGMEEEDEMHGDDDEEDEGEEGSDGGSDIAEGQETIERFKSSLFDDEDEEREDSKTKNLSKYERRLLALSSQIAELEQQNVGPKDWATLGEAASKQRPTNSLLDEDLEFERMGKTAPVVTEETTKGIEDLIKKRILDNNFDDVERRRAVDPNAFLPSRYLELQDTQSQKSLAEIYADDYEKSREKEQGREVKHELDRDLEKRHAEIEALFDDLAGKLDALSNARFTPKAPKASIETVSNLPSITLESALPTGSSASTLLAPEEVYTADKQLTAADKSTLTPAQKKALRQKDRTERKAVHERVDRIKDAKLKKRGVKGEKEKAAQQLIGTKGVTVIGKGGKEEKAAGKKRKRGDADGNKASQSSVGLKL
ncbi:hypothetical protein JCM10212_004823 [Sporobolomyces blumeae]